MDQITNTFVNIYNWAKVDYKEWPTRFTLEITAWFMSLGCSLVLATAVTYPLFFYLYPIFIVQCAIFGWAAWTRKSTGMVANYLLLVTIDLVGYIRLINS
jgi:branched-subunit amino acid permease